MSIANTVYKKIHSLKPGSVFCAVDFSTIGAKGNIDVILHRLAHSGFIRKLGVGLYDKPIHSDLLGDLSPNISDVISAYSRRTGHTISVDPLTAANLLNLTTQIPAQLTYLTNGKSHSISICGIDINFVHAAPKKLVGTNTSIGTIIQSLHYFGKKAIPMALAKKLAKTLSKKDIDLLKSVRTKTMQYITPQIDRVILNAEPK